MPRIHGHYLAAMLALIPLPARAQPTEQFEQEKVVSRWRSITEGVGSGRTEWKYEHYVSREGAAFKPRKTESSKRAFNSQGSLFTYKLEESGKQSPTENSLTISNVRYSATLRKPKGQDEWVLFESIPIAKDGQAKFRWHPEWLVCGNVFLPDWVGDPSFVVLRTQRTAAGLLRVDFDYNGSRRKSIDVPDHIKSGFISFDSDHAFCPMSYEYRIATKFSEQTEVGAMEYEFRGSIPLLKSVTTDTTIKSEKHGLAKTSAKWTYKVEYDVHVSDAEFRLSFYGLPEPVGVAWPNPTRWWLWLSLAAVGAIAIGLGWRKIHGRYRGAEADKAPIK